MSRRTTLTSTAATSTKSAALDPLLLRRVVIEDIQPAIDCGRFPIKRTIGDRVVVTADIHADGHDLIAAALLYRKAGEPAWREATMTLVENDVWRGAFTVDELGRYEYTVEGWIDRFGSWRHELSKKFGAGQDVSGELLEGAALLDAAGHEAHAVLGDTARDPGERVAVALSSEIAGAMARRADRSRATRHGHVLEVTVERERARFGAWYEMFPRSAGTDPSRSATFAEAEARLPYIASMGFDVLYLPPIHPIGRSFRKGPNNTLTAGTR